MLDRPQPPQPGSTPLRELDWSDIQEPGVYLHLASGLVARIYAEDLSGKDLRVESSGGGRLIRLCDDPSTPLMQVRSLAEQHGLRVIS